MDQDMARLCRRIKAIARAHKVSPASAMAFHARWLKHKVKDRCLAGTDPNRWTSYQLDLQCIKVRGQEILAGLRANKKH